MTEFVREDFSGARFFKTKLNGAHFRMCDLSGVQMRNLSLEGAAIDGPEMDGLTINGVEVAPLIEAELARRQPGRGLKAAPDPETLRESWRLLQDGWQACVERFAALPTGRAEVSVEDEWSFAQTLRHLVFATDIWLGAAMHNDPPTHPWGLPFTDFREFIDDDMGVDFDATPSYDEVLEMYRTHAARVTEFLNDATAESLAEPTPVPVWAGAETASVVRCVWVILEEGYEHLRFAQRDLAVLETA